ncbi:MAG: hypothetical protein U1E65_14910 [Myxococcota bacterium]
MRWWWFGALALAACDRTPRWIPPPTSDATRAWVVALDDDLAPLRAGPVEAQLSMSITSAAEAVFVLGYPLTLEELGLVAGDLTPAPPPSRAIPVAPEVYAAAWDGSRLGQFAPLPWENLPQRVRQFQIPAAVDRTCQDILVESERVDLGLVNFEAVAALEHSFLVSTVTSSGALVQFYAASSTGGLTLGDALPGAGGITTMISTGQEVLAATAQGALVRLDARARLLAPPKMLTPGSPLRLSQSPQGRGLAYAGDRVFELDLATTATRALAPPPFALSRAALGLGGEIVGIRGVEEGGGTTLNVTRYSAAVWTRDDPPDATGLLGFADLEDVAGTTTGFVMITSGVAWYRGYSEAQWRVLAAPGLGSTVVLQSNPYRHLSPMQRGHFLVSGAAGVLDLLVSLGPPDRWCAVNTATQKAFDGAAVLPDETVGLVIYNSQYAEYLFRLKFPRL